MGTKVTTVNTLSRGGSVTGTPSGRSLRMRATAYTSSYEDTGKSPGSPDFGVTAQELQQEEIQEDIVQ